MREEFVQKFKQELLEFSRQIPKCRFTVIEMEKNLEKTSAYNKKKIDNKISQNLEQNTTNINKIIQNTKLLSSTELKNKLKEASHKNFIQPNLIKNTYEIPNTKFDTKKIFNILKNK